MTREELAIANEEITLKAYEMFRADMRAEGREEPPWAQASEEVRKIFRSQISDWGEEWNEEQNKQSSLD